ncbi:MAG: SAM-dependent chlorinase/fluorinase [Syntrophaceae bacterium]|nr:SAM-dependent chlorinase/fluorinase [Syntrophaceae bacterium]
MKNSIITLLSDFGTKDHYVASMKGTILRINPGCTLVDITHHVNAHDVEEGAFLLGNAYCSFPKGTVHLAVVDPGVGGPRRPLLLVTPDHFFVGPDNGLFTLVLMREKLRMAVTPTDQKFFLPRVSHTFHGRDLFAPVAAHLSLGVKPEAFGPQIDSWFELDFPKPIIERGRLSGEVIHIDRFGNLITNVTEKELARFSKGRSLTVTIGRRKIQSLKKGYWEGKRNEAMALVGSGGFLEISVKEGSAQKLLKINRGDPVQVSPRSQAANSK